MSEETTVGTTSISEDGEYLLYTRRFHIPPKLCSQVFELCETTDDIKSHAAGLIKALRISSITGTCNDTRFQIATGQRVRFTRDDTPGPVWHLEAKNVPVGVQKDPSTTEGIRAQLTLVGEYDTRTSIATLSWFFKSKDPTAEWVITCVEFELAYKNTHMQSDYPLGSQEASLPNKEDKPVEPSTEETPAAPKTEKATATIVVKSDEFGTVIPLNKAVCKGVTDIRVRTIEGHAFFGSLGSGKFSAKADDKLVLTKVDPTKISNLHADLVKEGYYNDLWKLNNETVLVTAGSFADNIQASFLIYVDVVANCDTGTINVRASEGQIDVTSVSGKSDDPVTLHNRLETCRRHSRVEINSVELVITYDPTAPVEDTLEPEKKPETAAEAPKPPSDEPVFCCHCNANLTQAKEYVVLKEVEMMFPGPDIVTKYHCCPDCYDFLRKARAEVLEQMSNITDHSKVARVMRVWFHLFVTEAEAKHILDAKLASNAK